MNNFTDHWQIAYRKVGEKYFHPVSNPSWAWAADPFLVEWKGELFLFAELFLYKSERNGVIGFCKWEEGGFGEWTVSMDKHWHLSYPNIWVQDGRIHMIPESYQKDEVSHYILKEFPDKWERVEILIDNGKYVDTTMLEENGQKYLFTFRPTFVEDGGELLLYCYENKNWNLHKSLTDDKSMSRPGGNFFRKDGKLYRVAQDCTNDYGKGLAILEVEEVFPNYKEHLARRVYPQDLPLDKNMKDRDFIGVHTYNCMAGMEVIDLKYKMDIPEEHEAQNIVRRVFLHKYDC